MCEYIVLVYLCTGTLQFARIKKLKLKPEPDQNEGSGTSQIGTPTPGGSGSETLAGGWSRYKVIFVWSVLYKLFLKLANDLDLEPVTIRSSFFFSDPHRWQAGGSA